jgi:acetyltransferase-like isoleucine patch superfamily enzyme
MRKSIKVFIINKMIKLLPDSHFFKLKVFMYRWAGFNISSTARIYSSVNIYGDMSVSVGHNTFIGHEVLIVGGSKSKIFIGDFVDIAPRVLIESGSHIIDMENIRTAGDGTSSDITIENGVWIGAGAIILGGVCIGKKSIIAAGSLVNKDITSFSMAAGVPARVIKKYDMEKKVWISVD